MQNQSEREKLIIEYRNLLKNSREESNEIKKNELRKQASQIYDAILETEFEDRNIKRFNS